MSGKRKKESWINSSRQWRRATVDTSRTRLIRKKVISWIIWSYWHVLCQEWDSNLCRTLKIHTMIVDECSMRRYYTTSFTASHILRYARAYSLSTFPLVSETNMIAAQTFVWANLSCVEDWKHLSSHIINQTRNGSSILPVRQAKCRSRARRLDCDQWVRELIICVRWTSDIRIDFFSNTKMNTKRHLHAWNLYKNLFCFICLSHVGKRKDCFQMRKWEHNKRRERERETKRKRKNICMYIYVYGRETTKKTKLKQTNGCLDHLLKLR